MRRPLFFSTLIFSAFLFSAAPSGAVPNVTSEMEEASFWIERIPDPDRVLLSPEAIQSVNRTFIETEPTAVNPLGLEEWVSTPFFLLPLEREESWLLKKTLYDRKGRRIGKPFFDLLREKAGLRNIPSRIPVRFGVITEETSLRTFPTLEPVVEEQGKLAFDLLQQTTLHPGTPVAVLWESPDGEWRYLVSSLLRGWVQTGYVALFPNGKEEAEAHFTGERIVVIDPEVPFYGTSGMQMLGKWFMGTVLHTSFFEETGAFYKISRPVRDPLGMVSFSPVFVPKEGVTLGFLPLTPRQILIQAFKLHGSRYGWGGLKEGYDCSSFLRDTFLTMGVTLPRNSEPQSKIGIILPKAELPQSPPAVSFVKLDGHIMLYLGEIEGRPYVIHALAGYREPGALGLKERVVNTFRVLISDMTLGQGSKRGSLWDRTLSVNIPFQ